MKRDLRGQKGAGSNADINPGSIPPGADPAMMNDVQKVIDQYGGKSDAELMSELQTLRQSGVMDANALLSVASRITPMLNPQQQQKLSEVLRQLTQ